MDEFTIEKLKQGMETAFVEIRLWIREYIKSNQD